MSRLLLLLLILVSGACSGGSADASAYDASSATADAAPSDGALLSDAPPNPDGAPTNCVALPAKPKVTLLPGFIGNEDLTFDRDGNVIESDGANIYKTTRAGVRKLWVANLPFRSGMRMLPSGQLIVADEETATIWRIEPSGSRTALKSGLSRPNGVELGNDGQVYFTDMSAGKVYRLDPQSGASSVLTTGVYEPNGISFNVTYDKLYLASAGFYMPEAPLFQLEIGPGGVPGALSKLTTGVGSGNHDGIAVDACGNIYVTDQGTATVLRVTPSGQISTIVEASATADKNANLEWGSGVGGWERDRLYVLTVNRGIQEVEVGVPGKPRN